jgi:exopolysaccharide biosynthesis polyprenyl glycosylphosphotransferase
MTVPEKNLIANFIAGNRFGLVIIDTISISVAWILSYEIRQFLVPFFGYPLNPRSNYLKALPIIIIVWLIANSMYGLYNKLKRMNYFFILRAVFKSALLGSLITMSLAYWLREFSLGRSSTMIFLFLAFIFLLITRSLYLKIGESLIKKGHGLLNTLVVGAGETGIRAIQKISEHPEFGYNVVGFLDDDSAKYGTIVCNVPVLAPLKELNRLIKVHAIDKVIFAIPSLSKEQIFHMIAESEDQSIIFMIISNVFPVMSENMYFEDIGGIPTFILKAERGLKLYDFVKRISDMLISLLFMILGFPVVPFICLAIKLDSKGPVLFKQQRVGLKGKKFTIYKFRTMHTTASSYEKAPNAANDPRITRIGSLLRRFSLDELPQFFNVLIGDMSIIGPRPEMPFIVEEYQEWQKKRLDVRPGITGLWQVLGRKELPLEENLEYDFYYIKNRSLSLDIAILFKTIIEVLKQKGAY